MTEVDDMILISEAFDLHCDGDYLLAAADDYVVSVAFPDIYIRATDLATVGSNYAAVSALGGSAGEPS